MLSHYDLRAWRFETFLLAPFPSKNMLHLFCSRPKLLFPGTNKDVLSTTGAKPEDCDGHWLAQNTLLWKWNHSTIWMLGFKPVARVSSFLTNLTDGNCLGRPGLLPTACVRSWSQYIPLVPWLATFSNLLDLGQQTAQTHKLFRGTKEFYWRDEAIWGIVSLIMFQISFGTPKLWKHNVKNNTTEPIHHSCQTWTEMTVATFWVGQQNKSLP